MIVKTIRLKFAVQDLILKGEAITLVDDLTCHKTKDGEETHAFADYAMQNGDVYQLTIGPAEETTARLI